MKLVHFASKLGMVKAAWLFASSLCQRLPIQRLPILPISRR